VDPSILLILVTVGLLVLLTASRRRQQRAQQSLQSKLAPGSEVMTGSGMFATVVSVEDSVVILETAPGQQARWDRRAVARVLSTPEDADSADAASADAASADATLDDASPDDTSLDDIDSADGSRDDGEPTVEAAAPDVVIGTGDDVGRSKKS
jgi:preprotein translocase subunit YajC